MSYNDGAYTIRVGGCITWSLYGPEAGDHPAALYVSGYLARVFKQGLCTVFDVEVYHKFQRCVEPEWAITCSSVTLRPSLSLSLYLITAYESE